MTGGGGAGALVGRIGAPAFAAGWKQNRGGNGGRSSPTRAGGTCRCF